ncbi:creatininase family protein [Paenibacillus aceris]|uniref:Creatinine amidohydrolase n=1 Tax=Paenibacillus aceris TaxID=869555 RepID=A0ABS4HZL6_9BACL|nr:creatininase family protein [Paenibacillus aceris]MBP1964132.1 creatinine amidohydrolase [Paenibacillus aceris]NHW36464.1 creatininase family protein [Paenibacillus aceris]
MNDLLFHHGTRETLKRQAQEGYAVVVPLAATEQHGPHLPVFTDSMIGEHIAFEACKKAAMSTKLLLAPTLVVGCSQHHLAYGGTLSFSSSTYLLMLKEIGESLVSGGFRKIIYLNAHGGNEPFMHQAAQDLAVQHDIWTASASYWSLSRSALMEIQAQEMGMVPGHAGGFETSLIASLAGHLIRSDTTDSPKHPQCSWINAGPPGSFVGKHSYLTGVDGYTDSALPADAAKGSMYLQAIIESTAHWLVQVGNWMNEGAEVTK